MAQATRVADTIGHLIHRTDFALHRENSHLLERYGVTVYQAMSLIYVADHEQSRTVNQRALERYTQLTNPGVTKLVTGLERLELLERTRGPEDGRSYALRTTEKGRAQAEIFRELFLASDRTLTHDLTEDEIEQLRTLLKKVQD